MDVWEIVFTIAIIIQITSTEKCPTGCICDSFKFDISVTCLDEPFYVTDIPMMPLNTTNLKILRCDIPTLSDNIFFKNGGKNLYQIDLSESGLKFISQNAFSNLKDLKDLRLVYSFLHSLIGTEFSPVFNLGSLVISRSHLQKIPVQSICEIEHIETVILKNNEIKKIKLDECFQKLDDFYLLDLSNNPLYNLQHQDFISLRNKSFSNLQLDDCNLRKLEDNVFMFLINLKVLSLRNNKLEKLPWLPKGLNNLYVSGNHLKVIDDQIYGNLHFLHYLKLDHIGITHAHFGEHFRNISKLTLLTLQHNVLNQLFKSDFLNLEFAQVETLLLDACYIRCIEAGTFQKLHQLKYLSLTGNGLTGKALEIGLSIASWEHLEKLDLQENHLTDIDQQTFREMTNSQLREINIAGTAIKGTIPNGTFQNLARLEHIIMDGANIKGLDRRIFINSTNVKKLSLSRNKLDAVPRYLNITILESLFLSWNKGITVVTWGDLMWYPNLRILDLSHCSLASIGKDSFKFNGKLSKLLLHGNNIAQPLTPAILSNLENLEELRLSDNREISSFDVDVFRPIPHITNLGLNTLQCLGKNASALSKTLKNLTYMEILKLSSIKLDRIPTSMFKNMKYLSILGLSHNFISYWEPEIFKSQKKLTKLFLGGNRITNVKSRNFLYLPSLQFLDLSGNPFMCTCDLLSFRLWMGTNSGVALQRMDKKSNYKCLTPPDMRGTFLLDYKPTEESCMSYTLYIIILSMMITYFALVTCVTMLYRYWWYIRYWIFLLQARRRQHLENMDTQEYTFDAFVSYSYRDQYWVIHHLLPNIEYEAKMKLCLHQRNWIAGRTIPSNIVESIERSRKTILVMSNNFASSHWCEMEMTMAQHKLFDDRQHNTLVMILLEDIDPQLRSPTMNYLFARKTYLQWPGPDVHKQKHFWRALKKSLKPPRRVRYREDDPDFLLDMPDLNSGQM